MLPTEAPTPTLPVTQTPRPTERVAVVRATPRPPQADRQADTEADAQADPQAHPKPTPIPAPIAKFTCSFQGGLTIAFNSTSKYAKTFHWEFFGDGNVVDRRSDAYVPAILARNRHVDRHQQVRV